MKAYESELFALQKRIGVYLESGREDDLEEIETWCAIALIAMCSSASLLFLVFGNYVNRRPEKRELLRELLQTEELEEV